MPFIDKKTLFKQNFELFLYILLEFEINLMRIGQVIKTKRDQFF